MNRKQGILVSVGIFVLVMWNMSARILSVSLAAVLTVDGVLLVLGLVASFIVYWSSDKLSALFGCVFVISISALGASMHLDIPGWMFNLCIAVSVLLVLAAVVAQIVRCAKRKRAKAAGTEGEDHEKD